MTNPQLPPLPEQSMTHHITDEQIDQAVARGWCHPSNSGKEMDADLARAISDEVRAVLALAAQQVEPYGWAVTGSHSLYRGEWAESTAKAEAKRCGGTARAFPLYTAPAPAPAVPSGWRLVPVEPTPEMLATVTWPECARTDWVHMLTAAPTPPAQPAVPEDVARVNQQMLEALEDLLECPYHIDEATVSKAGLEATMNANPHQVVGNMSVALLRVRKARAAIDAARAAEKGGE